MPWLTLEWVSYKQGIILNAWITHLAIPYLFCWKSGSYIIPDVQERLRVEADF